MQNTTPATIPELDYAVLAEFVSEVWDESIVAKLIEYIAIPDQSPAFDPSWEENG